MTNSDKSCTRFAQIRNAVSRMKNPNAKLDPEILRLHADWLTGEAAHCHETALHELNISWYFSKITLPKKQNVLTEIKTSAVGVRSRCEKSKCLYGLNQIPLGVFH